MRSQSLGDKRDFLSARVRNAEATATIARGTPCILAVNGTEDGLAVVLPSSSTAAKIRSFYFGVALDDILAGQLGEVQTYGLCNYVKLIRQTRADSSGASSFASEDTIALNAFLSIDSANNGFSTVATPADTRTVSIPATDSLALSLSENKAFLAFLAQTLASYAASGTGQTSANSTNAGTGLSVTQGAKAFIRMM